MSYLFGPVVQQAYVVPDIEKAMQHWLARGVGPFFKENINSVGIHDGKPTHMRMTVAFSFSGDQQIELIQVHDDEPTVYRKFMDANPQGGLHHLGVWVDNIADKLRELEEGGHRFQVRVQYLDMHAYIDSVDHPGVMIQLMANTELNHAEMDIVRNGADTWDGVTNPIRLIDYSSGRPVLVE